MPDFVAKRETISEKAVLEDEIINVYAGQIPRNKALNVKISLQIGEWDDVDPIFKFYDLIDGNRQFAADPMFLQKVLGVFIDLFIRKNWSPKGERHEFTLPLIFLLIYSADPLSISVLLMCERLRAISKPNPCW